MYVGCKLNGSGDQIPIEPGGPFCWYVMYIKSLIASKTWCEIKLLMHFSYWKSLFLCCGVHFFGCRMLIRISYKTIVFMIPNSCRFNRNRKEIWGAHPQTATGTSTTARTAPSLPTRDCSNLSGPRFWYHPWPCYLLIKLKVGLVFSVTILHQIVNPRCGQYCFSKESEGHDAYS